MTNLTILEAFRQTLSATKKYVNNRIDGLASETYVNNAVAGLVDSAPEALNTLNELASALGNDANFATTISNQIGLKANSADLATVATSGSYNDLSDKPTIPTKVSQLQNDSDFATETFVTTKIEEAQLNGGSGSVAKSYVTYEEFGAKCDSVYDDGIAIKLAHEHANQNNLTVKPDSTKTYYIKQAHSIPIINNTDLNNATFIIDDTVEVDRKKNVFEVKSKKEPITIVDLNFTVNRTTVKLSNLSGHGLCLVQVINANKKQFIREGSNSNEGTDQQDYFVIDNEGSVLTDIIWDFEQITSCTLYPFDDTTLTIKNAKFITRSNGKELQSNYFDRGLNVNRSNVILENISHRVENEQPGSPYHGFISGKYCAYLTLKNCSVQSRKAYKVSGTSVWLGSYDIEMYCVVGVKLENVIDVTFDNKERWGAFASNFCKDIVVENSTLSRVDAHQGARNITIRNSVIGNQGLRIIGSGLCLIEDSKILNSTSLITLRSDYGSSWEGVLVIRRTYWKPDATYAYPRIINFANASNHEFGYTCYFPRLIIDDLEVDDIELSSNGSYSNIPIINNNTASFGTDITSFTHPYHFTDNIECKNMRTKSDKGFILFNSSTINLYNKNPFTYKVLESTSVNNKKLLIVPNTKIVLDNVKLAKVSRRMNASGNLFAILDASGNDGDGFTNNANHVLPLIHIKNCENVYAFTSNHPMILELEDSVVSTLLNVGASTRMNGKATGCLFKPSIDGIYQSVNTNYGDFAFTDCKFDTPLVNSVEEKNPSNLTRIYSFLNSFDSSQNKYSLIDVKMDNCNIYDGSRNMDLSNYVTTSEMTDAINDASLGGSGTSQSTGLTDNSVKFQHLNEALRNRLFEYRDINCNKLSWTKNYVNGSFEIKYSNICLLSECLNVERGEKILAENGHEFKIVYYEGDTISSLSKSYVTSIEFTQPAKIRIQASRQDSAAMDLSEFLSKQNIIYSKFAISTGDNPNNPNNPNNLNKIHIITNTIKDNYKPLGSDYIKFVDGTNKLDSLYSLWDNLMSEHSDYITKEVIGQDSTGLNINVYKLTPPSKKMWMNDDNFTMLKIIYISCLHGDEPNAPYSDFRFFKHLATGHASNDTLRMLYDNVEFVVCPIANPWGYNNNSRRNSNGVNLSRNFPANWTLIEDEYDYSGTTAASEIETQLIMKLIDDNSDAFFLVDRHGTATFTQVGRFGYTSSNFKSDRKISYDLFRRLDSSLKDSFKFINSDEPANITRNILGVSLADAVGNLHNYANITKNMNGVLLELGARRFGDSYPTGTLQDMQAMEVEIIGALLETVVLNNSFLLLNK